MSQLFRLPGVFVYATIVFLNAFVDLGHKIIVQNTLFKTLDGAEQVIMTAVLNAMILLPLALCFTPSGFVSDRYAKPKVMQMAAWLAVGLTLAITASYYAGWFVVAFILTFLLAVQSAFYSPAKYGYLRELVGMQRLAQGNAMLQATTIVAILGGTFAFSILFENLLVDKSFLTSSDILRHVAPVGWFLVIGSVVELVLAYRLPHRAAAAADIKFDWASYRTGRTLKKNMAGIYGDSVIWICIVGLALFWGISQVMVATFPAHAKETLGETNTIVIQGLIACTGIGMVIGSAIAGRLSRNYIETGFIPIGAVFIAIGLFILPTLTNHIAIGSVFLLLGVASGFFVVPLNALIQFHAPKEQLARILAGNNLVQTVVMLSFLGLTVAASLYAYAGIGTFLFLGIVAALGAVYTLWRLPQSLLRFAAARGIGFRYSLNVVGLPNLPSEGGVLLLGNHVSFIDWAIVGIASARPVRFVMHRSYYSKWYLKWFLDLVGCIPISSGKSKDALLAVKECLDKGQVVCLFPEGALTRNGQLGEFKRGYERAAEDANAVIVPFYIQGLWGSRFSRADASAEQIEGEQDSRNKRQVTVAFGPQLPIDCKAEEVKQRVFDLSVVAWQTASERMQCIGYEWLKTASQHPRAMATAELNGNPLSNARLVTAAALFGRRIAKMSPEQNIGLLLPASTGGLIANLACWLRGKTVVNLNYTASESALLSALSRAEIKSIYTSRRFIKKLADRGIDLSAVLNQVTVVYLEDLKEQIGKFESILTLVGVLMTPLSVQKRLFAVSQDPASPAAILFSSGSEGEPKGVVLSHRNLLINVKQVSTVLNATSTDRVMGTLPIFHAFGLTATTLLPVIEGLPVICHPDPTDVVNVAKAIGKYKGTLLFGTSTFLRLYARNRKVKPIMLQSLRLVVAGAEKLSPDVAKSFKERFGKDVFEGFGATETAPVAAVNLPDLLDESSLRVVEGGRAGTVGLPVPGTSFRIVDPVSFDNLGIDTDGLILISGPQVMQGYLGDPQRTADVLITLDDRQWYHTGDKGRLDEDGYLTIVDRYSRFAKLGGEMVSLGAVEEQVRTVMNEPDLDIAAVALPDEKKGETVILLVAGVDAQTIKPKLIQAQSNPMLIPAKVFSVDEVPKLGTGKADFSGAKQLALNLVA